MSERVRMTLDLSPRLSQEIERLAALIDTSKADILRYSVELLSASLRSKSDGYSVGAWIERDGKRTEREFIILPSLSREFQP